MKNKGLARDAGGKHEKSARECDANRLRFGKKHYIRDMLHVLFVRLPANAGGHLARAPLATLHHEIGEALVRFYLRRTGFPHPGLFPKGPHGKPLLVGQDDLFFNVSHSGDMVVAAFSEYDLGVDIERHGRARLEVANRFFHPAEQEMIRAAAEVDRARLFADLWTIKESYVKYLGTGIPRGLPTFRVEFTGDSVAVHDEDATEPVHVCRCAIADGYSCFTCAEVPDPPRLEEIPYADL
jgi:4'-phosphopantetheinyl transferase